MPRIQPDRAALEIAYGRIKKRPFTLDQMLAIPAQRRIIENEARSHIRRREKFDIKKMQSGDND